MLSPDPGICLIHPCKRPIVGVCHLCLTDRLSRLSTSGGDSAASTATTFHASSSSRASFDSSAKLAAPPDDCSSSSGGATSSAAPPRAGPIFSLIDEEQQQEYGERRREYAEQLPLPPSMMAMTRSRSLSQWTPSAATEAPRRSISRHIPGGAADNILLEGNMPPGPSGGKHHFSWITSIFGIRKRKKKCGKQEGQLQQQSTSLQSTAHQSTAPPSTAFFPAAGWSDPAPAPAVIGRRSSVSPLDAPPPERLWRSRSVSSSAAAAAGGRRPSSVASLIAVDLRSNALYDCDDDVAGGAADVGGDVAGPMPSVAELMRTSEAALRRSSSTGKWRKRLRGGGDSPSSVLQSPAPAGAGSDWSFYLTPLRTFRRHSGYSGKAKRANI